jgi:hypothetical protein
MAFVLVLALVVALVAVPIVRSSLNPVVTVVDELRTTAAYDAVDAEVAQLLGRTRGYELRMLLPGTYTLSYRRTPGWALVLGVVTFPIGLLVIILSRETLTITVSVTSSGDSTRITVVGQANRDVALSIGAALDRRFGSDVVVSPAPHRRG